MFFAKCKKPHVHPSEKVPGSFFLKRERERESLPQGPQFQLQFLYHFDCLVWWGVSEGRVDELAFLPEKLNMRSRRPILGNLQYHGVQKNANMLIGFQYFFKF